ncbi:MAG: hypothetical protein Q9222_005893 [Ikaeria aurantiellina]
MHEQYGPIVRINPDELHVEDAGWYEVLYAGAPARRDKWPPAAKMAGNDLAGFGTVDHHLHGKRRAALSPLFSSRAIASADDVLHSQIDILSSKFVKTHQSQEVIELRRTFVGFTTDTIHEYALGEPMGFQKDEEKLAEWNETLDAVSKMTPIVKQFPWMMNVGRKVPLGWIRWVKPEMAGVLQIHKDMYTRADRYLAEEGKSEEKPMSGATRVRDWIFRCILESSLPAHEKTVDRLAHEGFSVIVAGGETTSRVLAIGVFYILEHPLALQRIQEVAEKVMPDVSKPPASKALENLPYLTAVVKEILRMSAMLTSRLPIMPHEELKYKDWVIPRKVGPTSAKGHPVQQDVEGWYKKN